MATIEPYYRELGLRILRARERAGLTQQQLADQLKPRVTRASVANMESAKQRILCHTLVALSEVLAVPVSELISGSGDWRDVQDPDIVRRDEPLAEIARELKRKVGRGVTSRVLVSLGKGPS